MKRSNSWSNSSFCPFWLFSFTYLLNCSYRFVARIPISFAISSGERKKSPTPAFCAFLESSFARQDPADWTNVTPPDSWMFLRPAMPSELDADRSTPIALLPTFSASDLRRMSPGFPLETVSGRVTANRPFPIRVSAAGEHMYRWFGFIASRSSAAKTVSFVASDSNSTSLFSPLNSRTNAIPVADL